jgi:hypothetical protein
MDQKIYKFGVFPFGLGLYGTGPTLEEEEESMLVKYNTSGQKIYTSLTQYGDVVLTSAATIATGDVQVSIDGGAFQNIITTPTANNSCITISLSDTETTCQQAQIRFKDQTIPPEWNDKVIGVETYGNASAYLVDTFDNNVVIDSTNLATSAQLDIVNSNILGTSAAVKLIPTDNNGITVSASNLAEVATSAIDISSLATSAQAQMIINDVLGTSAAVKLIPTDNNGITVSASNFIPVDISMLATSAQSVSIQSSINLIPTDNNGITVSASNMVTPNQIVTYMDSNSTKLDVAVSTRSTFDPLTQGVSAVNEVAVDLTPIINRLDSSEYGLSAINDNVLGTSAMASLIPTDNNGITVSASNFVATDISSLATSAQATSIMADVLGTSAAVKLIPIDNNGITVSASNFVATDISSLATSAVQDEIFAGVNGLIIDVMYDPNHALSALDVKILGTSAAVKLIPTDNNGITVSASNFIETDLTGVTSGVDYLKTQIDNTSYGLSAIKAKVDETVNDVLGSDIDGMPMQDALVKILAWAIGKTEYSNDVFTYFKQDNTTQSFALSASDTNRTRL